MLLERVLGFLGGFGDGSLGMWVEQGAEAVGD
jgi:hypothetical protein